MKNRRISFALSAVLIGFLCLGFVLGTTAGRAPAYRYLSIFAEVLSLVRGNYVDEVDQRSLMKGAYSGMVGRLDPYSSYLTAEEYAKLTKEPEGPADPGIDMIRAGETLIVVSVTPGSPAEKAGLKMGDFIWTIDGTNAREVSLLQSRRLLSGPEGSEVDLHVLRNPEKKRQDLRLKRIRPAGAPFEITVESAGTGYVRMRDPGRADRAALAAGLRDLEKRGASQLLLDLRGVTRGGLDDALKIAGLFVGETTVVRAREKSGHETEYKAKGAAVWSLPVFLLVNEGTAGASEIVAGALKDSSHAKLLGETTCGFGARQDLVLLPSGDALLLSVAKYFTPSGKAWFGEGLKVDEEIRASEEPEPAGAGTDVQLRRALEIIAAQRAPAARAA